MNISFSAAERMRLLPRLRILQHATRLLCEQLPQVTTAATELRGAHPIDWDSWEAFPVSQPHLEICSLAPLKLPSQAGICARVLGAPLTSLAPLTLYQLPDVTFSLLSPTGETSLILEIHPGRFQTFAHGAPERQILEYLATVLDLELLPLGFRCLRQGQSLCFEALPSYAGWNLTIQQLGSALHSGPYTAAGLHSGLSSLNADQQSGVAAHLHWGPYLINGQHCAITLPFDSDLASFATAFLNQLQAQLKDTGCSVNWTSVYELLLTPPSVKPELEIQALPGTSLDFPDVALELPLPTGSHRPTEPALRKLGELVLNDHPLSLEAPADLPRATRAKWLCDALQQSPAGIQAHCLPDGELCLTAQPGEPAPTLSQISTTLGRWLGLSPSSVPQQPSWQALWTRWSQLRQQVLEALPADGLPQLRQSPLLADAEASDQSARLNWVKACQDELNRLQLELEKPLAPARETALPAHGNLALPKVSAPLLRTGDSPSEPEKEATHSRFDHKI